MSVTLALGLLLQGLAVGVVLLLRPRHSAVGLGALFVGVATIYHGVTELVQQIAPGDNPNRRLTSDSQVADWTLLIGISLLAFTVGYAVIARRSSVRLGVTRERVVEYLDWRPTVAFALVLVAIMAVGKGKASPGVDGSAPTGDLYVTSGLVTQFLPIALSLASFAILARTRGRGLVLVLAAQCALHTLAGQRLEVAISAACLLYLLWLVGIPISRKQCLAVVALVAVSYLVILNARAIAGREKFDEGSGFSQRLNAVTSGVVNSEYVTQAGAVRDLGVRLDGNSYPSIILKNILNGAPTVGFVVLGDDVKIAVPRFLDPGKLNSSLESRSLKTRLSSMYGITNSYDRLPTQLGELLPIGGPALMVVLAATGGLMLAGLERLLVGWRSPFGILGLLALANGILLYEGGLQIYTLSARGVFVIGIVLMLWQKTFRSEPVPSRGAGREGGSGRTRVRTGRRMEGPGGRLGKWGILRGYRPPGIGGRTVWH